MITRKSIFGARCAKVYGLIAVLVLIVSLSSCTSVKKNIREPNARVEFVKGDFEFSDQVSAEASSVKVFCIDWARLFNKKEANVGNMSIDVNIPIIGDILVDQTVNYSLYNMLKENPGYDVVFYPQYEKKVTKPVLGLGFIVKKTTVKTTARLGKIKK